MRLAAVAHGSSWLVPAQEDEAAVEAKHSPPRLAVHEAEGGRPARVAKESASECKLFDAGKKRVLVVVPEHRRDDILRICEAIDSCGYSVECLASDSVQRIAGAIRETQARVLLFHVELLQDIDMSKMLHLRRQFPATDWVIVWHVRSARCADLVIRFQARGCIDCDGSQSFGLAIDAVFAGDLWFPRWLTQSLYVELLSTVRQTQLDVVEPLYGVSAVLTQREAESFDLMRQGLTNKEIAHRLQVSVNTVKKHLKASFDKRGLHSRRQAVA